ncbi:MAG: hypothetical protein J6Q76_06190 [Clostridia bacterium]|nr:hypothetical protein [Clostridia bacterium]
MFNKKIGIIAVAIFVVMLVFSMISVFMETSKIDDYPMFSDIEECYSLENYKLDDTPKDKYVKGLDYKASFVATVKTDDFEFEIFAYEFETLADAKNYYKEFKELKSEIKSDYGASFSAGHSAGDGIVFNGQNLYRISCSSKELDDVVEYLLTVFTLKL